MPTKRAKRSRQRAARTMPERSGSPFLLEQEAAAFLRLRAGTLQNKRLNGKGPAYLKLGGRVVYEEASLLEWARAQRRTATTEAAA